MSSWLHWTPDENTQSNVDLGDFRHSVTRVNCNVHLVQNFNHTIALRHHPRSCVSDNPTPSVIPSDSIKFESGTCAFTWADSAPCASSHPPLGSINKISATETTQSCLGCWINSWTEFRVHLSAFPPSEPNLLTAYDWRLMVESRWIGGYVGCGFFIIRRKPWRHHLVFASLLI